MKCPATPSTNDIPPTKLPPRPPTFKREVRSSPVQRSKRCPISECLKKIEDCMKELLGYVEDCANSQMSNSAERSHNLNSIATSNNTGVSLENSDDGCTETVTVEQRKEALIVDVKCPCGASYQILLLEGICYYKLV
ncbi:Testis-expressed sequence 2 protein [Melia azedarach]|uniref:Testis-expressed sequence 2 protein n=1 Tax=Melia azedarach TaxID=155640 RepID=A0ACC1YH60_MELAZ|nr:Testis-expressed sequence 2 protein [Melia azedarach]